MTNTSSFSFNPRVLIALAALGLALNFMRISADYVISFLMAWIIAAVIILITIVALTPLFYALPEATLGAIVIHAVWHLINFHKISQYRKITSLDFWTAVIATLGVLALGILQGLMLAVFIGLLALIIGTKTRSTSVLGRVPGENIFRGLENYPDGETYPGLLILRFDGSLFFANAPEFAEAVRAGVELSEPPPKLVLVDGESVNGIDATAINTIIELNDELARKGITLRFARMRANVMEIMHRAGLYEVIGVEDFYTSVHQGVDDFLAKKQGKHGGDQEVEGAAELGAASTKKEEADWTNTG